MDSNLPVIVIELVLVLGGVLAFGWWQLRDVRRAREQTAARKAAANVAAKAAADSAAREQNERTPRPSPPPS